MFHQYQLSNGIKVISEPMENRKTVALGVFIKVGSQDETGENNGISHLIEHMFFKGTNTRNTKEIADLTASLGDDVNAFTSKECTALYGMTITEKLDELAGLLGDLIANAKFDSRELAKEKRVVMDEIDMYQDSPEDLVHELLQKRVWRDDALGFLISGTKSIVRSLHREDLYQFLSEYYYAENMLISAAGGYAEEVLRDCLERTFSGVQGRGEPKKELHLVPDYYRSFAAANKGIEQLHLNLAFPALCVGDRRRFAYSIFNSVFGGSNNSRLFQKIREEAGMAYSVYSYSSAYQRAGLFHIDITVQPSLAILVLEKTAGIIKEFVREELTKEELRLHKQQVGTELIMSSESPKTRMDANAKFALAGTKIYTLEEKLTRIEAVDCAEIQSLAAEILALERASLCIVGEKSSTNLRGIKKIWERWNL